MTGAVPPPPPPAPDSGGAIAESSDPLVGQMQQATEAVLAALESHGREEIDFESLRRRAFDAGVLTDGSFLWLLDVSGGRWVRYDGLSLVDVGDLIGEV